MNLPTTISDALWSGKIEIGPGVTANINSTISPDEANDLFQAVRQIKAHDALEIGLGYGLSSLAISSALRALGAGKNHVIDPFQNSDWDGCGVAALRHYQLENHFEFFEDYPEKVQDRIPPVEFAFIDGSHLFDFTIVDFVVCDRALKVGGILALHDCQSPSVQKVVRYLLTNRGYKNWIPDHLKNWNPPWTLAMRARSLLASLIRYVPFAASIFAPELITPSHEVGRRNLLFFQKIAQDSRKHPYHCAF